MRPVVYFPELRLGERAVQAHSALGVATEPPQKSTAAAICEAAGVDAIGPKLVRRDREMQTCVIEALAP